MLKEALGDCSMPEFRLNMNLTILNLANNTLQLLIISYTMNSEDKQ
jgi:hypothetical protein